MCEYGLPRPITEMEISYSYVTVNVDANLKGTQWWRKRCNGFLSLVSERRSPGTTYKYHEGWNSVNLIHQGSWTTPLMTFEFKT
jgi:hypothetical protein